MKKLVEIRSYELKPGTRARFHDLVLEQSLPMLRRWQVDVVAFGPSSHDADSYYLMRAYDSLDARNASQAAFYGSDEWRQGPREAIVALIDKDLSVTLELDAVAIDQLRANPHPTSALR